MMQTYIYITRISHFNKKLFIKIIIVEVSDYRLVITSNLKQQKT